MTELQSLILFAISAKEIAEEMDLVLEKRIIAEDDRFL